MGAAQAKIAGNVAALPRETIWNQHSGKTGILRYGGTGSIGINLYTALSSSPIISDEAFFILFTLSVLVI